MTEVFLSHHLNGNRVEGSGSRKGEVYNPATGEQTKTLVYASESQVEETISVAKTAFEGWATTPPISRARVMFRFLELLNQHKDTLSKLIIEEHGKILSDAAGEVTRGIEVVEYACGIPALLAGDYTENVGKNIDSWSVRQPLGVCVGITPFNFPAMVPMWMFPIAIACGNSFILKPSEKVPSASLFLADLLSEAGLPDGVFNVLNGDRLVVDMLLSHEDIASVSFVGSTPVAHYIHDTASRHGKRVQALGGAKNHAVILPDADLKMAINGLTGAAYGSAGERCMAISVAVAVGDIAEPLVSGLADEARTLQVLPGDHEKADMGPLITAEHKEKVSSYIETGAQEGADLVVDGRGVQGEELGNGFFLGPTLFDHVNKDMTIYKEEIFGPVLSVVRALSAREALELVNNHPFGNGAAIFTRDGRAGRDFAKQVKAGMVGINVPIPVPVAYHSFGGWKSSLFGDHHMHGSEGVRFFTKLKTVSARWPDDEDKGPEFSMPILG